MKDQTSVLEQGSYPKLLLHLCLPTILVMLVMTIYNMADIYFIGQTNDASKVAALSLCGPVFTILSGLGTLLGSGGCTAISLALGRKETERIRSISSLCAVGSCLIGVLSLALITLFLRPIALLLGADSSTLEYACVYLRILACGAPFILFGQVFSNLVRADGAAVESMICNGIGTLANILLDAVFILGFSMDIAGAALATVLGNVISCVYIVWYIRKKKRVFSLNPKDLSLSRSVVVPVLTLGLPLASSTLLMSVSNLFSNRLMMAYGSTALAAQGVAGKIGMLIDMLLMGICMGLQPAISYNYAAGHKKRMLSVIRNTGIFTVCLGSALGILCYLFRSQIVNFFLDDASVLAIGCTMALSGIVTAPFYGLYQLCQTFLQATGKASLATLVAMLDKGICYLPALYIADFFLGMYGVAFAPAFTLVFSLAAGIFASLSWYRRKEFSI